MKPVFKPSKRAPIDPLERAEENALAYRDLARADARQLEDYDDHEESTARHDIPPQPPPVIHNHVHLDSVHDSEPPAKKQLKSGLIALGSGLGLALITAAAALLQRCH